MIVIAAVLYGLGYFVLALSHALSISLIIALVLGFLLMMQMASSNTCFSAPSLRGWKRRAL